MSNLSLIVKREYLAKVRNKSFVIMTILSPVLMVAMVVLIAYLSKVNDSEKRVVAVLNESNYFSRDFVSTKSTGFVNFKSIDLQTAKDSTLNLGYYGLVYIPNKSDMKQVAEHSFFYSKDAPNMMVVKQVETIFRDRIQQQKLENLGVSPNEFKQIDTVFEINTSTFTGELNLKGINEIKAFIGGGFGYLIMMFIIIYGGFVMRSVIEEKTSRIIEIIISSVKPFELMLGKIIGTSLAGITQFAIWIFSAGFLLLITFSIFSINAEPLNNTANILSSIGAVVSPISPPEDVMELYAQELFKIPWAILIIFFILYFVLGYLIYSSIYAAIGAAVDNETDTQQFMFPIISPLVLALYVGFFSVLSNPHGPIAVGFSLFPLTSPIIMLIRLPGGIGEGGVPIWQLIASIALLLFTFMGIVWLAAKIYKVGILMYGKKPSYNELIKWLKY